MFESFYVDIYMDLCWILHKMYFFQIVDKYGGPRRYSDCYLTQPLIKRHTCSGSEKCFVEGKPLCNPQYLAL